MATPQLPGAPQYYNGTQAQLNQTQSNGASTPQQTQSNGAIAMSAQSGSNTFGKDAIREGKQRARDTMAAAGVNVAASTSQDGMSNGSTPVNGQPKLCRKRSRDGSQLPVSQPSSQYASHHDALLDRTVQRDLLYASVITDHADSSGKLVHDKAAEKNFYQHEVKERRRTNPGSIFGPGFRGYENRTTDQPKGQIVWSVLRREHKGRKAKTLYFTRKDNAQQAEQREELVPVRLDIELDKLRLRDTFTWNLHEKLVSQDKFIEFLIEDLKIPNEHVQEVARQVRVEMQDQIQNYYPHVIVEDGPLETGRPYSDHKDDEMRILIKINITIGRITLVDQFEWDINNPLNSPEEFARQMAIDNALSGEFTTAIAHSIREQSQLYTKSLWLTNHCFDGRLVEDPDLKDGLLPNIHSVFRPSQTQATWTPYMYEMSEAELERIETSMMREHRAQKRQLNRRGGPALPDLKDRPRTIRSLIVHHVIPGAVESYDHTGIPKTRRSGRGGRRGAARADGDVDSEDLESEESGADSPAPSMLNAGTARTRGMRGAATAAQAAMRAGFGRSVTPDIQTTPHDTRTASRRSNLREEEVVDDDTMIVKLKIGRAKLKAFWNDYDAKKRASQYPLSGYASQPPPPPSATPSRPNINPPTTPRSVPQARNTPQPKGHQRAPSSARQTTQYDSQGRVDTDHYPYPDEEAVR